MRNYLPFEKCPNCNSSRHKSGEDLMNCITFIQSHLSNLMINYSFENSEVQEYRKKYFDLLEYLDKLVRN